MAESHRLWSRRVRRLGDLLRRPSPGPGKYSACNSAAERRRPLPPKPRPPWPRRRRGALPVRCGQPVAALGLRDLPRLRQLAKRRADRAAGSPVAFATSPAVSAPSADSAARTLALVAPGAVRAREPAAREDRAGFGGVAGADWPVDFDVRGGVDFGVGFPRGSSAASA
jgi:hypothetical protein